jgi:hypothetical protein
VDPLKSTPPNSADPSACPTPANDHSGVAYQVEVATDLAGPWETGAGFTEVVSAVATGDIETVKVRSLLPTSTYPQQFLRMRVTQLP